MYFRTVRGSVWRVIKYRMEHYTPHGGRTKEAVAVRAAIQAVARLCRQTLEGVD
jgi:hypothetical protein